MDSYITSRDKKQENVMTIEISKDFLLNFLVLANLKGDVENKELLINVSKKTLLCEASSLSKYVVLKGLLSGDFEDWGEIGIDDLPLLKNFISSLPSEKISLTKKDNKLITKSGTIKLSSVLRNSDYILNKVPSGVFDKLKDKTIGNEFVLNKEDIHIIVGYYSTIKSNDLVLRGEDSKIILTLENQSNELVVDFEIKEKVEKFEIKLSKIFVDLISATEGDLIVSAKDKNPVYVKTEKENCIFEYIVSPTL